MEWLQRTVFLTNNIQGQIVLNVPYNRIEEKYKLTHINQMNYFAKTNQIKRTSLHTYLAMSNINYIKYNKKH